MSIDAGLQRIWYGRSPLAWLLLPFSALFALIVFLRRQAFTTGLLHSERLPRPIIVIGNLTVGGTGKTPLVIWLAHQLQLRGRRVGIITRGYGGRSSVWPQQVTASSDPLQVGDEAVLIATETQAIVVAGADRIAAARMAINQGAELILSDDGLQHYRLQRDMEVAVVDSSRMLGNGWPLPAGPLREPASRLRTVDVVLINHRPAEPDHAASIDQTAIDPAIDECAPGFRVVPGLLRNLVTGEHRPLDAFAGRRVHVVTAIGNPSAFIRSLQALQLVIDARQLRDHAALMLADVTFNDALPVLMTGKDAVKCRAFAGPQHWAVGAEVVMDTQAAAELLECVEQAIARRASPLP